MAIGTTDRWRYAAGVNALTRRLAISALDRPEPRLSGQQTDGNRLKGFSDVGCLRTTQ